MEKLHPADCLRHCHWTMRKLRSLLMQQLLQGQIFGKYQRYEDYRRGNTNLGRVVPLGLQVVYFILGTEVTYMSRVHQSQQMHCYLLLSLHSASTSRLDGASRILGLG